MDIKENVSLKNHSTMRLGGQARWSAELKDEKDIGGLIEWARQRSAPFMMIGQGSNIVWRDEGFAGLLIINRLRGRQVLREDEASATIQVGAGEVWDEIVAWTVEQGWSGIEFLSLIPGLAGAAPVQNIGAYGGELADILAAIKVYDTRTQDVQVIPAGECGLGYRTSRFKTTDKGRFMILALILRLHKRNPAPPFYESLAKHLDERHMTQYSPAMIREAVIQIRRSKLPDPAYVANNGSFFTNPIVEQNRFVELKAQHPDIKSWPHEGRVKIPAAWLVERAGFKAVHDAATGMGTWPTQCLVMVNEVAKSTADLLAFKQKIVDKVEQLFGIRLEQEPELLP